MIVQITSRHGYKPYQFSDEEKAFIETEKALKKKYDWSEDVELNYIGNIQNVPISFLNNRNVDIEFFKNNPANHFGDVSNLLALGEEFSSRNLAKMRETDPAIHIHIPSPELAYFNQVDWLEDGCTQKLQDYLDDGWRIIAAIPRPGQRRPDYVIGKRKN